MTPNEWFDSLRRALEATALHGAGDAAIPDIDEEARRLLLDLARIAAHRAERWAAPLSTYMVGHALATVPAEERTAVLRAMVDSLDVLGDADTIEGDA